MLTAQTGIDHGMGSFQKVEIKLYKFEQLLRKEIQFEGPNHPKPIRRLSQFFTHLPFLLSILPVHRIEVMSYD